MSETDLIKLYSSRILALAADMPRVGVLENADAIIKKRAPLCGSTVTVSLNISNGVISDYAQDVKACALGQAAASVVGASIVGCTTKQVVSARDQLKAMLKNDGPVPDAPFDGLEVLLPARDYKNRHDSILLTLNASVEAIAQITGS
ncbi:MAG: iron-sulfur cluster assembly scaffold protein [Paracoccaceae bacterium]|jgi:NifU-like protein involved in Fe-S cluster formation|nr:iron-sulfur cluster assembly scaffold protein [Paracoccaceae bacterium]MDP7184339.1 iron-sulfur cluster assembly scaffold protein [Paracoccaceae bacterium]